MRRDGPRARTTDTKETTMDERDVDLEARLTRALRAGAEASEAAASSARGGDPDPVALRRRAAEHRRRRALVGSAAAALVLGVAVAGWAVGREGGDDGERVIGGPSSTVAEAPDDGIVLGDGDIPSVNHAVANRPLPPGAAPHLGDPSTTAAGLLFTRTLDDGSELEVRANAYDPSVLDLPPFWTPPGGCFPVGELYVGARFTDSVGQLAASRYVDLADGTVRGVLDVIGVAEEAPRWLAVATVPLSVARVVIRFPDGGTDEMAPVDGVVVLSAPVADGVPVTQASDGGPDVGDTEVDLLDADGEVVGSWADAWPFMSMLGGEPQNGQTCVPPNVLPAAGPHQPEDRVGAEAAIRHSWATMYGHPADRTLEEMAAVVDDPRDLSEGLTSIQERYDAEQISRTTVEIDEVVFASPERAYVTYTVDAGGMGSFPGRFGELRLIDGTWKLTRQTVCSLLGLGGYRCPPVDG